MNTDQTSSNRAVPAIARRPAGGRAMTLHRSPTGLERVARAGTILSAIRVTPLAVAETANAASRSEAVARSVATQLLDAVGDPADTVTGIAAVHALASIPGNTPVPALAQILQDGTGSLPAHAAWVSARRPPASGLLEPLLGVLMAGGLAGMHAQSALARWAETEPWLIAAALRSALQQFQRAEARHHLVETLGLVKESSVMADLASIAADPEERDFVRVAAVAAFGDRPRDPLPRAIAVLSRADDRVAQAARLALCDRSAARGRPIAARTGGTRLGVGGLRVAQVHLGATLDPDLLRSGMGDTGGIATLLVKLGAALERTAGIAEVITIGRDTVGDVPDTGRRSSERQRFAAAALQPEEGTSFADPWPARVAAERAIRRVLRGAARPDVIHLRMADVGTLAAANAASTEGIGTVFSLAPDPHGLIAAREAKSDLDRRRFGADDAAQQLWYRANLVERLARHADQVALFPRDGLIEQLHELVGIDVNLQTARFTVVPEGIDVAQIRAAVAARASGLTGAGPAEGGARPGAALGDLLDRLAALPPARHGLPIVLSVGRLNEIKGMGRLAQAFALVPALRARATLVIVGGDLEDPSPAEAAELARIEAAQAAQPALAQALVLLGHRPNGEVAHLLAAARYGVGELIGRDGAYACASRKEEFGLAIVEALAAGLPVVAPLGGGPQTYVEDGRTGSLVDTGDPAALARGVARALDLARLPGRAEYAVQQMAHKYDISTMARSLTAIYGRVVSSSREQLAS